MICPSTDCQQWWQWNLTESGLATGGFFCMVAIQCCA